MNMEQTINHVTCGCCSNGCVCEHHQDVPRGFKVSACAHHSAMPYAPLDRSYRFDVVTGDYIRVPLPAGAPRFLCEV